jgi:hypothetical protein
MTRRKSILGLALTLCLGITCIWAFGASNSSALWVHECINAEGVGTLTVYKPGCKEKKALGGWETVPIKKVNPAVTKWTAPWWLRWILGGIKFKVECGNLEGEGNTENVEFGEIHTVVGSEIHLELSSCTVTEPAGKGCEVKPFKTTELKSETETSGLKSTYSPAAGETFTTVTVSGCSIAGLNGEKKITGKAVGINETATPETTEFTEATKSELKVNGVAATIFGSFHIATKNTGAVLTLELP